MIFDGKQIRIRRNQRFISYGGRLYEHDKANSTPHDQQYNLVELTEPETNTLEHALGIQVKAGRKTKGGYRNYFCSGADTLQVCLDLVRKGMLKEFKQSEGTNTFFTVTLAGKIAIGHKETP